MLRTSPIALLLSLLALATVAPTAHAQIGGPTPPTPIPWPLGCPIPSVVANDSAGILEYTPCHPIVADANGQLVFIGFCMQVLIFLPPGGVGVLSWNQTDNSGQQVPPGVYSVNGLLYDVGATDCALMPLGAPFAGARRAVHLCAPAHPDAFYVLAASGSISTGIPLGCGRTFPLDLDTLLLQSIAPSAVFTDFIGQLDAFGTTSAPAMDVPAQPSLVGVSFHLAFMTLDPTAPCGVGAICDPVLTTIR
ncbi:hypothetical protein Pla163_04820 [Planctomycetes bacterium Pla163]|uniref:Uncharacterized protein n=1 Tax=Rohdeia mirabilis TaxID=2528008 RepID=A0A518CVY0_9BACT|nr:hypothetical protein Pla163_04820 [Planctomycetes bacterium Pla163]